MPEQRILVLRLSSFGDVILCSSFLRSLRAHFPAVPVDFVVREDLEPVAAMLPGVERVIAIERSAGLASLLARGAALSACGYSHVFDLHGSLRSRLLVSRMRGRVRPGFDKQLLPRWALVYLHRDWYAGLGGARSMRDRMLDPLRRLGLPVRLEPTELCVPEAARREATAALERAVPAASRWIGVAPGARWPSKRWPGFAGLTRTLAADGGAAFAVLGSREEAPLAAAVAEAAGPRAVSFAGRLDLTGTAAVLARCDLVITNDSGLLHMAEAVGRPVLAFWGATSPAFGYAPYRPESRFLYRPPPCSPCSKNGSRACHRPTHECMENITVGEAAEAARGILPVADAAAR